MGEAVTGAIGATGSGITAAPEDVLTGMKGSLFGLLRERRGWSDEFLATIENRVHPQLVDMPRMVEALALIKDMRLKIVVMPDFDMDGITSGVVGLAGLAELGFDVELYVPDYRNGHDITVKAVDDLAAKHPGARAVITCDAGINSKAGIQRIKDLGMLALVTDHHVELDPADRVADVAIDPGRVDDDYERRGELGTAICGAHVLWQLLDAYARAYAPHKTGMISLLRLFAGIGTVTDVMPLTFENRQLVRDSLSLSRLLWVPIDAADDVTEYDPEDSTLMGLVRGAAESPQFVSVFEGYAYVLKAFREAGKLRSIDSIDEGFYGFYLGPAFNSIRRIDGRMEDAFGSFVAPTPDEKTECVERVIAGNEMRKETTKQLLAELLEADPSEQPWAPFVYVTDAPSGMLGLLANQLMERSQLPTVVISRRDDETEPTGGSARSPFWYPVISTLGPVGFFAIGHENACGVRLDAYAEAPLLRDALESTARAIYDSLHASGELEEASRPDLVLGASPGADSDADDLDALMDLAKGLERLEPFGHGFPRPSIELSLDLSKCHVQPLGQPKEEGEDPPHVRIVTPHGLKVLWWNQAERIPDLQEMAESVLPGESVATFRVDVSVNEFMGNESVQAQVERLVEREL